MFIVMDLLEGRDLVDLLLAFRVAMPPLAIDMAVSIAVQLADALGAFHRVGVLHRDIKPNSVSITRGDDGHRMVKLLDLSRSSPEAWRRRRDGRDPALCGARADTQRRASHRSEVFSVGMLLYEMLAGQDPFAFDKPPLERPAETAVRVFSAPIAP